MRSCALLVVLAALAAALPAQSNVINVPGDYSTINDAMDNASSGDTVRVAAETYREWNIRMVSGVTLESEGHTSSCVTFQGLSGGPIIEAVDAADFVLDGFTFLGAKGTADGGAMLAISPNRDARLISGLVKNCHFEGNMCNTGYDGGAVFIQESQIDFEDCSFSGNGGSGAEYCHSGGAVCVRIGDVSFTRCTFMNNSAWRGGAVFATGGASVTFSDCVFCLNGAAYSNSSFGGGAVCCYKSVDAAFANCLFEQNTSQLDGGAINTPTEFGYSTACSLVDCVFDRNSAVSEGGAVKLQYAGVCSLNSCTFTSNSARDGGGLSIQESDYVTVRSNEFFDNSATAPGGDGGGAHIVGSNPWLKLCLFANNAAAGEGGALYLQGGGGTDIDNCTIVSNRAGGAGTAAYLIASSGVDMDKVIIAFGGPGEPVAGTSVPFLSCSDIWGNENGNWVGSIASQASQEDNFTADPLFCDMFNGDYTLCDNSQCVYTYSPCGQGVGAFEAGGCGDCNAAVEETSWGCIKSLYR